MKFNGKGITNDWRFWIPVGGFVAMIAGGIYWWHEGSSVVFWMGLIFILFVGFFTWLYGTGRAR